MGGATASACIQQTLAVTLAVQAPRITIAQTQELSGIATSAAPGGGASTPLPPGTTITLQLSGPDGFSASQTTTVIGSGGAYSLTWPAGLAPGNYEVIAHLSDQPGVQSSVGSFTVQAVVVPPPPPPPPPTTPQAVPALAPWATIGLGALLALLSRQRLRRRTG